MWLLLGALATHALIARAVSSPWWIPDLTLVGLVLAVARTPSRWLLLSAVAGICTMAWAGRFPQQTFLSYIVLGWVVQALGRQWDATDPRVQVGMVGLASALLTLGGLWLDELWLLPLLGLSMVRVALTILAVPCVRHLAERFTPQKHRDSNDQTPNPNHQTITNQPSTNHQTVW